MALARQSMPAIGLKRWTVTRRGQLAISATVLAAFCGLLAFVWMVIRDRGHANVMINEQAAPPTARVTSAPIPSTVAEGQTKPVSGADSPKATEARPRTDFSANKMRSTVLGPVKLKLLRTDEAKGVYDISVLAGRRTYTHRRLKVNQSLWIAANRGNSSIEMVVTAMSPDSVSGYWSESERRARVSSKTRPRNK